HCFTLLPASVTSNYICFHLTTVYKNQASIVSGK
ncbi:MAG: hypothetical protein ACI9VT_003198, partial [Psychroserpens sp.]